MFTIFYPETDGQSECTFGVFQEMMQVLDVLQHDWVTNIAQLEFACNNTVNDTTYQSPLFVASGQHPPIL
jgi:hypothetical protein